MITSVSKSLAQQIVNTVHDICGHDINFINKKGIIFASTDETRIGTFHEIGKEAAETQKTIEVTENDNYKGTNCGVNIPITHNGSMIAVIGISGRPDEVRSYAFLAEKITRLFIREQELNNTAHTLSEKKRFLLNALTSGNLENEEYLFSILDDFQINKEIPHRIIIVRISSLENGKMLSSMESKIIRLFERLKITVFCDYYPNQFIALANDTTIMENISSFKSLSLDNQDSISIGIGRATDIYQLNISFQTASIALANVSFDGSSFALFDDLTLEIVLNSISTESRTEYLNKVLAKLSAEDIELLHIYYEEGQSLSRTCNRLFLHKNTLQYKLDRIYRLCGHNPRDFKDAVVLYLAIRLKEYPASN